MGVSFAKWGCVFCKISRTLVSSKGGEFCKICKGGRAQYLVVGYFVVACYTNGDASNPVCGGRSLFGGLSVGYHGDYEQTQVLH